jgi:transcriptional regulator with XRE-family HTH domain
MGELGDCLRQAREAKGLSIEEVSAATRIQRSYLEALESETHGAFSSELHGRGFARNYAAYLGLDVQHVVELYDAAQGKPHARLRPARVPAAAGGARGRPPARERRVSTLLADIMLVFIGLAFLGVAGMYLYRRQTAAVPEPTGGPTALPTATALPAFERTAYTLDIDLHYPEHKLDVRQKIDYTNVTSQTLSDILLNVHPNRIRGAFKLNDIKIDVDGEMVQPEVLPLDVTLSVVLPRELPPGEHVAMYLDYTLSLPRISADAEFSQASFGYSKRAVSLGNWYPVVAPYREDKGWYALRYFEIGDPYMTDIADYSVTITGTEGIVVAGTGEETRNGNRWHYTADRVRSFALAASDAYLVETAQAGPTKVYSYYFPGQDEAGKAALDAATNALLLYGELYGAYPYRSYRVAETEFSGGMEFGELTFLGSPFYENYDGSPRTTLTPLVAHEAAHQWFYGLVGNDQVVQPWLDEALAQYSSLLYYERYLPGDVEWWWDTEVRQWAAVGKIDSGIYLFRSNRDYMDAVYRRGAEFVRDLRTLMGDPTFFAFLKEYARRYAYQTVTSRDFFSLVQEYTTADLMPLQEEYFRQRILP